LDQPCSQNFGTLNLESYAWLSRSVTNDYLFREIIVLRKLHRYGNAIRMAVDWTALPFARLSCHPDGAWRGLIIWLCAVDKLKDVYGLFFLTPPSIT